MKITADNGGVHVEISLRVTSFKGYLTSEEASTLRTFIADRIIKALGKAPFSKFSVARQEVLVKR